MSPRLVKLRSENNDFQHAETLSRNRSKRQQHRKFFVEGVNTIEQALTNRWNLDAIYYAGDVELSSFARNVLKLSTARRHFELPSRMFNKLRWASKMEKRSELIALIDMPPEDVSRIPVHEETLVVVFDRPSSHGNLGTIVRTCEAFGVDGLVITGHAVDLYDPQTVRASMSSLFSLPIVRLPSHNELGDWFDEIRSKYSAFRVVGSSAHAARDLTAYEFTRPMALVLGNEAEGLSASYKKACDEVVRIPMYGTATSLNVASAASILMYEIDRHRSSAISEDTLAAVKPV